MISFGGLILIRDSGNTAVVGGRVFEGPIEVGQRFQHVVKRAVGSEPHIEIEVSLVIDAITLYGHPVDRLDSGLTGELTLRGSGLDLLPAAIELVG